MSIIRIQRVATHQNAKVMALLFAITSLLFILPMVAIVALTSPAGPRPPMLIFLAMPVGYLVFGYLTTLIMGWAYNALVRYTGGIEFES